MITRIECENFYSIGKKVSLDFTSSFKKRSNSHYYDSINDMSISMASAVVGLNASGKTNILRSIPFFKYLICETMLTPYSESRILLYSKYLPMSSLPSYISVTLNLDGVLFKHVIRFDNQRILSEEIYEKIVSAKGRFLWKKICSRSWTGSKYSYDLPSDWIINIIEFRQDVSMITTIACNPANVKIKSIYDFWHDRIDHNLASDGMVETPLHAVARKLQAVSKDHELNEKLQQGLKTLNINYNGIVKIENPGTQNSSPDLMLVSHKYGDVTFLTKLKDESSGARKVYDILPSCIYMLGVGGVLVLDEFDAFLNPYITNKIIDLFINEETNPLHAQLIFSCHSANIIGSFEKNRVFLCRNTNGYTEVSRFDDFIGVRGDISYISKYLAGDKNSAEKIDDLWTKTKKNI